MHLVIYGPEGSGKGTQAALIAEKYSLPVYTSGDLVRETAANTSGKLGDACRKALSEGAYVSDNDMFELWKGKLVSGEAKTGFILDGFPRTLPQANFLLTEIKKCGYTLDRVIFLSLSDEESITRLTKRHRKLFAGSDSTHDTPELIGKRLKEYRKSEKTLVSFFQRHKLLLKVDGAQTAEAVYDDIVTGLSKK
jgi:adenylate kinase